MKELDLKEMKKIQLAILDHIDDFCKKHNIVYFINYGTLLGAIRHKGYIPWDDDIDISMSREHYDRFIKLYKENNNSKYKLIDLDTNKYYYNNFIKIEDTTTTIKYNNLRRNYDSGIFVDIFPVDYFENRKVIHLGYYLESLKLISISKKNNIIHNDSKTKDFLRLTLWYILKYVNPRIFAYAIEKLIKKYTSSNPSFGLLVASKSREKSTLPLQLEKEIIYLDFEGRLYPAPKKYEEILSHLYGNYMQLPPKKDRVLPHDYKVYRK